MQNSRPSCVKTSYAVLGNGTTQFPYQEGIDFFAQAVEIARHYPQVFSDGASTHVLQNGPGTAQKPHTDKRSQEQTFGCLGRWKVFQDGRVERIDIHFKRPSLFQVEEALDPIQRAQCLDERTHRQLVALIRMAERLGDTNCGLKLEEALTEGVVLVQDLA